VGLILAKRKGKMILRKVLPLVVVVGVWGLRNAFRIGSNTRQLGFWNVGMPRQIRILLWRLSVN